MRRGGDLQRRVERVPGDSFAANGTACVDGTPCTKSDTCTNGSCSGAGPGALAQAIPQTVNGTTSGQANEIGASCGGGATGPELGYLFTAPFAGSYVFDTIGSTYDTVLHVRNTNCSGGELACDDDAGGGAASKLTVALAANQTVEVFVDGFGGQSGAFTLHITCGGSDGFANSCAGAGVAANISAGGPGGGGGGGGQRRRGGGGGGGGRSCEQGVQGAAAASALRRGSAPRTRTAATRRGIARAEGGGGEDVGFFAFGGHGLVNWSQEYKSMCAPGENNCTYNTPKNNSVYVRVFRNGGGNAACAQYTLRATESAACQ